jgi:hypothetical protein
MIAAARPVPAQAEAAQAEAALRVDEIVGPR